MASSAELTLQIPVAYILLESEPNGYTASGKIEVPLTLKFLRIMF